jgi:hypothetical protein
MFLDKRNIIRLQKAMKVTELLPPTDPVYWLMKRKESSHFSPKIVKAVLDKYAACIRFEMSEFAAYLREDSTVPIDGFQLPPNLPVKAKRGEMMSNSKLEDRLRYPHVKLIFDLMDSSRDVQKAEISPVILY